MNKYRTFFFAALTALFSLVQQSASADSRPLSDFLNRQGAWCSPDDGVNFCEAAYYTSERGVCEENFSASTFPHFLANSEIVVGLDTLGELAEIFGFGDIGTTVDGSVSENATPAGTAEVRVLLRSRNAWVQAYKADPELFFGELLFGERTSEVLAGAETTVADAEITIQITNTAPGAPLPDLHQLFLCPEPGQSTKFFNTKAQASGPLRTGFGVPDGTPGRLEVSGSSQIVLRKTGK